MSAALSTPRKSLGLWLLVLLIALVFAALEQGWARWQAGKTEPGQGADWIWAADVDVGEQSRAPQAAAFFMWHDLDLQDLPSSAWLEIVADESYRVYLNGHWLGSGRYQSEAPASLYTVTDFLREGVNRVTVELRSRRGVGGLLFRLRSEEPEQFLLSSGPSWKVLRRFDIALLRPDRVAPEGEAPQVWGGYSTGRWRVAPAELQALPGAPRPALRVRNTSPKARWVSLARKRQFPRLGPFLVFDWQEVVSGHLTLFFSETDQPALLYCGSEYPDPERDSVTWVLEPIPGSRQWTSVESLEFRYCLSVGVPIEAPPRVEPADVSLKVPTEDLQGVWGIEPPLSPEERAIPPVWQRVRQELREARARRKNAP